MVYDANAISVGCFAVALEAHDNDIALEDHSVQLYAPVTSTGQTTQTTTQSCFLSTFQQFCKVCNGLPMFCLWKLFLKVVAFAVLEQEVGIKV